MHNPAVALLDLFETWDGRNGTPSNQTPVRSEGGWAEIAEAIALVEAIAELLEAAARSGKRVTSFQQRLPDWRASIVHHGRNWTSGRRDLEGKEPLENLAAFFEAYQLEQITVPSPEDLRSKLDEIEELLTEDGSLDRALVRYIMRLMIHVRHLLDRDRTGEEFDLAQTLQHLKFCMDAASAQTENPETKKSWAEKAQWFATQIGVQSTSALIAGVGIQALTGGA